MAERPRSRRRANPSRSRMRSCAGLGSSKLRYRKCRTRRCGRPFPTNAWKETCAHLHLMTQIVGKVRLKQTPWINHSWHVALYVTPRGLTTGPIPHGDRIFDIAFDFIAHELHIRTSDGGERGSNCSRNRSLRSTRASWRRSRPERARGDQRSSERNPQCDTVHAGSRRSSLRCGSCASLLARPDPGGPDLQAVPHELSRQVQSRAFFLGQPRSRCDAILRPAAPRFIRAACRRFPMR